MSTINPIKDAITVFLEVKKVIDKLDDKKKSEEVGSKLRARAREIPEMILELGLVPTLSFCIAKAEVGNIIKAARVIVGRDQLNKVENIGSDELAYAIYTYILLKYLTSIVGKVNEVEFRINDLIEKDEEEIQSTLIEYLKALIITSSTPLYGMLQPYLLQFKRLCEATFNSGRR